MTVIYTPDAYTDPDVLRPMTAKERRSLREFCAAVAEAVRCDFVDTALRRVGEAMDASDRAYRSGVRREIREGLPAATAALLPNVED